MNPIQKLKGAFRSVDQQLSALREQDQQLLKELADIRLQNEQLQSELQRMKQEQAGRQKTEHDRQWMETYNADNRYAYLQLAMVEQLHPGNRQRLQALQNTHCGETCFIVANGPSLKAEDLTRLHEKGVFTFASKRINSIYSETPWRPDVWAASDLNYIQEFQDEIQQMDGYIKLLPCQSILSAHVDVKDAIYFPFFIAERRTPCWFYANVMQGVQFWGTVTCKLINFAVFMGFKKIYLIGADHSYPMKRRADGTYAIDTSKQTHFSKKYFSNEEEDRVSNTGTDDFAQGYEYMTQAFRDVAWHCDQLGVEVYNATRGGKLEAFPRVDLDELFRQEQI